MQGQEHAERRLSDLIPSIAAESFAQEIEEARAAGALAYMARLLVQATMPHRDPKVPTFERRNGVLSLAMVAHPRIGLPHGSIPRLLLSWATTEAVRTKERDLNLGPSLSTFLSQLDLERGGGPRGNSTRVRNQLLRLFSSSVSCAWLDESYAREEGFRIADKTELWWDPKMPDQPSLWTSSVRLSEGFYRTAVERPIPVDLRALRALRQSPMALDLYCWLTYRFSYLRKPTTVPWAALQLQFGADYTRERAFREKLRKALTAVLRQYPLARLEDTRDGIRLIPSPTHVAQLR